MAGAFFTNEDFCKSVPHSVHNDPTSRTAGLSFVTLKPRNDSSSWSGICPSRSLHDVAKLWKAPSGIMSGWNHFLITNSYVRTVVELLPAPGVAVIFTFLSATGTTVDDLNVTTTSDPSAVAVTHPHAFVVSLPHVTFRA